jgi:hypothetical protein
VLNHATNHIQTRCKTFGETNKMEGLITKISHTENRYVGYVATKDGFNHSFSVLDNKIFELGNYVYFKKPRYKQTISELKIIEQTTNGFIPIEHFGRVSSVNNRKKFFFIKDVNEKNYFVPPTDYIEDIKVGTYLTFLVYETTKGMQAFSLKEAKEKERPKFQFGIIKNYNQTDGHGSLVDESNEIRRFLKKDLNNEILISIGSKVYFTPINNEDGLFANNINQVESKPISGNNQIGLEQEDIYQLYQEISSWKLEARAENISKYFYYTNEAYQIENGSKCFVIGRKGTGKTALAEYLYHKKTFDNFTGRLNFFNFPFDQIFEYKNPNFDTNKQYVSIWKLLIYRACLKQMISNNNLTSSIRSKLSLVFPNADIDSIIDKFSFFRDGDFKIEAFSIGLTYSPKDQNTEFNWLEELGILENLIYENMDESKYFVLIDALDDGYNKFSDREQYLSLIMGLFKAVQEIKFRFNNVNSKKLYPVVFLRSDIYDVIKDGDKTKWRDFYVPLNWSQEKIKKMLIHRVFQSLPSTSASNLSANQIWSLILPMSYVTTRFGNRNAFNHLIRLTYNRPRDFVYFFRTLCQIAINREKSIDVKVFKQASANLSSYLRNDLQDEITEVLPEISRIMDIFTYLRKAKFTSEEFIDEYSRMVEQGLIQNNKSGEKVLEILYEFSIIGNFTKQNKPIFKFYSKESVINLRERLILKEGLHKCFRIDSQFSD